MKILTDNNITNSQTNMWHKPGNNFKNAIMNNLSRCVWHTQTHHNNNMTSYGIIIFMRSKGKSLIH